MASNITLPILPQRPMFDNGIMVAEWQDFFRDLDKRLGGFEAYTIDELENIAVGEVLQGY